MASIVNPEIEIKIVATDEYIIKDLYMDFDIVKDVDSDPNEAIVTIYNLNADTRAKLVSSDAIWSPVEIHLSPAGSTDKMLAFRGEIETVRNKNMRPGHSTTIHCLAEKSSHYAAFFDQKTFAKGTGSAEIIIALAKAIGLPYEYDVFATPPILLSQSFSGSAFQLLEKFAGDRGYRVYVNDGVLFIKSIYKYEAFTPRIIDSEMLLSQPIATARTDDQLTEMYAWAEAMKADKQKRTNRSKKKQGPTAYIEYDIVDKIVNGMDFEFFLQPDIQPNDIITVVHDDVKNQYFRVRTVNHFGNNEDFRDWTTVVQSDFHSSS